MNIVEKIIFLTSIFVHNKEKTWTSSVNEEEKKEEKKMKLTYVW